MPISRAGDGDVGSVGVRGLAVVVPVCNEQQYLPRCLTALAVTRRRLPRRPDPQLQVQVIVVLDRCTDRSAEIVAHWPDVDTVVTDAGLVGVARAAGIARALQRSSVPAGQLWIACTDADSAVPPQWLATQWQHARAGADVLLGMVTPDARELPAAALLRWQNRHPHREDHDHVFGANFGVRGDMYERAGGFPAVATGEDHLLVQSVRRLGGRIVASADAPVMTSARQVGRAPEGFARYLHDMITGNHSDRPATRGTVRKR